MNDPFLVKVHSVFQIRVKFRSHLQLLSQIKCLITLTAESSIDILVKTYILDELTGSLTGYPCEPLEAVYYWEKMKKAKYLTQNSIRLTFVKKTCIPNPFESLRYIKCYCSNSSRLTKSPSNTTRYCRRSVIWENQTGIQKIGHISLGNHQAD